MITPMVASLLSTSRRVGRNTIAEKVRVRSQYQRVDQEYELVCWCRRWAAIQLLNHLDRAGRPDASIFPRLVEEDAGHPIGSSADSGDEIGYLSGGG